MTNRGEPTINRLVLLACLASAVAALGIGAESARALELPTADLEALVTTPGPPNDPVVGRNATFSALVANQGPDPATGVRVACGSAEASTSSPSLPATLSAPLRTAPARSCARSARFLRAVSSGS